MLNLLKWIFGPIIRFFTNPEGSQVSNDPVAPIDPSTPTITPIKPVDIVVKPIDPIQSVTDDPYLAILDLVADLLVKFCPDIVDRGIYKAQGFVKSHWQDIGPKIHDAFDETPAKLFDVVDLIFKLATFAATGNPLLDAALKTMILKLLSELRGAWLGKYGEIATVVMAEPQKLGSSLQLVA